MWISSSECYSTEYKASRWLLDVWSLLPFGSWLITTMKGIFVNSERLLLEYLPTHSPKSVAGCLLPLLPFFLASWVSLAHIFKNISTHCRWILLAVRGSLLEALMIHVWIAASTCDVWNNSYAKHLLAYSDIMFVRQVVHSGIVLGTHVDESLMRTLALGDWNIMTQLCRHYSEVKNLQQCT